MPTIVDGGEERIAQWRQENPAGIVVDAPPASEWPFRFPLCPDLPAGPVLLRAANFDTAFVNAQTGGTQLVTTQRRYLEEEWAYALDGHQNALLVLTPGSNATISHLSLIHI